MEISRLRVLGCVIYNVGMDNVVKIEGYFDFEGRLQGYKVFYKDGTVETLTGGNYIATQKGE